MLKVYSLYDKKAEVFSQPFFTQSHAHATRMVTQLVNDSKSVPAQFPEDYSLLYLCDFDDVDGEFRNAINRDKIVELSSLKKEAPNGSQTQG